RDISRQPPVFRKRTPRQSNPDSLRVGNTIRTRRYQLQTVVSLRSGAFRRHLSQELVDDAVDAARQLHTFASAPDSSVHDATARNEAGLQVGLDSGTDGSKRRTFGPRLANAAGKLAGRLLGDTSLKRDLPTNQSAPGNASSNLKEGAQSDTAAPDRGTNVTLEVLEGRLHSIEQSFAASSIAYANRWIAHPLYVEMIESGYSAETCVSVLSTLASRGVPPNAKLDYLKTKVYEELRRRSGTVVAHTKTGRHVFVGDAGSGKTNLILKAANDADLLTKGRTIVLTIGYGDSKHSAATAAYTQAGIESLHVHSAQQLAYSLEVLARYETVLIDTPPLSPDPQDRLSQFKSILEVIAPLDAVTVHFAVDVRRNLDDVAHDLTSLNLNIDALALCHLDGLARKGRLMDFLRMQQVPVYFVSAGIHTAGNGLDDFSPTDILSESLGLTQWPYTAGELADYFGSDSRRVSPASMNFGNVSSRSQIGI
ncbi:MAG: hypothetical protein HKN13_14040, partial [Rhodothermales bacterium]|nr:hypothetical protein [Rhodothermales bacterium]